LKYLFLKLIKIYQKYFSLDSGYIGRILGTRGKICRFKPSCSEYTYQAINKYGVIKGGFWGIGRIVRCNPWNKGGKDPVK